MSAKEQLTADEISEINEHIACYEDKSAVSIEALIIVQKNRGWVSDDTLRAVAEFLGISPAQLEGVATFYNRIYRRPVGKTVIHYCNSVTCWMLGAEQVKERLCRHLQVDLAEMTADGAYTVLPIMCLGACDHAPAVLVGDRLIGDVDEHSAVATVLK
jgi:NADH-quinone oxidoreductase subunit E